jgi:hypothetical protein
MRLRGDGNLGIGSLNPNLAGLVVNKKVGNSHAIFGDNTSGVSIESNFPGIHFNSYYNGSRKTISTGFTAGAEMNPTTGEFSIYTSPASTMAGSTASVFERLKITKDGVVNVGAFFNLNNPNALNTGVSNNISFGGSNYTTGFISTIGTSNSAARMAFYTGYSFTGGASSMLERLTISNTGNVGIANTNPTQKLEVNGKIKIADDTNTAVAGNVRWNSFRKDFEGYDGSEWLSLTKSSSDNWSGGLSDLIENGTISYNPESSARRFGTSMAINGNVAVIGTWYNAVPSSETFQGRAAVFNFNAETGQWVQTITLMAPEVNSNDWFGFSVAFNGSIIAVGAPNQTVSGIGRVGKVYIFTTSGTLLNTISGTTYAEEFGTQLAINGAGHLAVSAPYFNSGTGKVYTYFVWGSTSTQVDFINSFTDPSGGTNQYFGFEMVMTSDYYLLIGTNQNRVAVYKYQSNGGGLYQFSFIRNLTSSNGTTQLGLTSIQYKDIEGTLYDKLFIMSDVGKAIIFKKEVGTFTELPPIILDKSVPVTSVAIKDNVAFIGIPGEIHVFSQYGNTYSFKRKLKPSVVSGGFGQTMVIGTSKLLVGSPEFGVDYHGRVYSFDR